MSGFCRAKQLLGSQAKDAESASSMDGQQSGSLETAPSFFMTGDPKTAQALGCQSMEIVPTLP